jgi:membrane protein DedA with SNARE-associated domain
MEPACVWIHSYGYLAVLLLVMLEIVGLRIPHDTVLLFVGGLRVQGA